MQVDVRKMDGVGIIDLQGKLVAGTGDAQLRDAVNDLLSDQCKKLLINLSQVSSIDSSGVGELVASLRVSEELGASLKIIRSTDESNRAGRVLRMAHILPMFKVFDDESSAIASFS